MSAVRFERKAGRTRKGCIVYVIGAPVLTFVLWIPLSAVITWLLPRLGVDLPQASNISVIYLWIIFAAVCRALWKDARSAGKSATVVVDADRVDIDVPGRGRTTVPLSSLDSIRLETRFAELEVLLCS